MRHLIAPLCLALAAFTVGQAWSAPSKPTPARPAPSDQPPPKLTIAQIMDRQLTTLEKEFVPAAEAMPDDKFNFAPTQGEFKGVRTFALQVRHVANTNSLLFSALLGEKLPPGADARAENGSDTLTSKADILKFLRDSFAMGHRAMSKLSEANLTERVIGPDGKPGPTRLGAANLSVWHSYDHYGQMVEYLRMNGIVPPASRNAQ